MYENYKIHSTYLHSAFKMQGLDANKKYKVVEINQGNVGNRGNWFMRYPAMNKVFTGEFLMDVGIQIFMFRIFDKIVIELNEVK